MRSYSSELSMCALRLNSSDGLKTLLSFKIESMLGCDIASPPFTGKIECGNQEVITKESRGSTKAAGDPGSGLTKSRQSVELFALLLDEPVERLRVLVRRVDLEGFIERCGGSRAIVFQNVDPAQKH